MRIFTHLNFIHFLSIRIYTSKIAIRNRCFDFPLQLLFQEYELLLNSNISKSIIALFKYDVQVFTGTFTGTFIEELAVY